MMRHELHKAYNLVFGHNPQGAGLVLERSTLARTFREKAQKLRPERAKELGRSKRELSDALKALALAFDLLADVVGEQDKVWVMPVVDDFHPDAVRPWAPRTAPAHSVKIDASAQTSKDVQEATRRIKDAIGKLKAQTEALAKNRMERTPKPPSPAPSPLKSSPSGPKNVILGRYLHRRGLITLRQLISAVAWQRAQRPSVGQIAKAWGILTEEQVIAILKGKETGELFGDYAVRAGYMTPFQRLAVVGRQRVMQKPIGTYFVEQGILTEEQVKTEVEAMKSTQKVQHPG